MEKASPVEMRKALEVVEELKRNMVLFVPVPVLSDEDKHQLYEDVQRRLDVILDEAENNLFRRENEPK